MPEKLYGLRQRTADALAAILAEGADTVAAPRSSSVTARGYTWVKVTGGVMSGWYPAVVSLDYNATFTDLTGPCKVQASDGSALSNGNRYLCTRTGNDPADGQARFRTTPVPGANFAVSQLGGGAHFSITVDSSWRDAGGSITDLSIPSAGTYLVSYAASASGQLTAGGPEHIAVRLWNETDSAVLAGTTLIVCGVPFTGTQQYQGGNGITLPFTFNGAKTIRMEAFRTNFFTSTWTAHPALRDNSVSGSVPGGTTMSYTKLT